MQVVSGTRFAKEAKATVRRVVQVFIVGVGILLLTVFLMVRNAI